jgi:hypothetical protein
MGFAAKIGWGREELINAIGKSNMGSSWVLGIIVTRL